MSWQCPNQSDDFCKRLNQKCKPGMSGCILSETVKFIDLEKEGKQGMKRKIIKIDQAKCDGCGICIPNCHEGALQIIDGKAKLVNELHCDGLGACIGHCPQGAITIEEKDNV